MLCLNNIQKVLSNLTHSKTPLPDVKELLSAQGYTGIQKGDEFIDLHTAHKAVDSTQDLVITQDLISFTLSNGKKVLIQKHDSGIFTLESNFAPQAKSYDEVKINQALEDFASEELEEKLTQRFKEIKAEQLKSTDKKSLTLAQDADKIVSQEIKESQSQKLALEKQAEQKAQIELAQAQKDAMLGKAVDEVALTKGQTIPYQPLRDTRIILKDDVPPFEASFAIVNLQDILPNFTKSNTQGRVLKQEAVIKSIINDFKPELLFFREGGVDGGKAGWACVCGRVR